MIARRNKPVGIEFVFPGQVAVEAVRVAVDNPAVLRAAAVALAGLQRAVAQLNPRDLMAMVGADLTELARLAGTPAAMADFQRRVADELARDGATRFKFDAAARDVVEAATAAERALALAVERDRARMDERLARLRAAGVSENDIAGLPDAAAPDRTADRARVDALKVEAKRASEFLADPLRRLELLPASIAPRV
jgi:hypothetical protein